MLSMCLYRRWWNQQDWISSPQILSRNLNWCSEEASRWFWKQAPFGDHKWQKAWSLGQRTSIGHSLTKLVFVSSCKSWIGAQFCFLKRVLPTNLATCLLMSERLEHGIALNLHTHKRAVQCTAAAWFCTSTKDSSFVSTTQNLQTRV